VVTAHSGIVLQSQADSRSERGAVSSGLPSTLKTGKNGAGTDHSRRVWERYPCDQISAAKRSQETDWVPLERNAIIFFVSMG
jgi:hypothetical protein